MARDDRDDDRRGSSRDRDRGDDRGRDDRSRDERKGRERDDADRGSSRDRDRGDDRTRSSRGAYEYQPRSAESLRQRAENDSRFDKFLKPHLKMWKPSDGENRIRILPPTWEKPKHYGHDIYVHYGVGADRQSYLCLNKMLKQPDPIAEERSKFARDADTENEQDKQYLKDLDAKQRVLVYIIDRDHEKDGVQVWAMPSSVDKDIIKISVDRDTGEVLPIDDPDNGFDVIFDRSGQGARTKYEGVTIARRSSPLGRERDAEEWMDFVRDNPLPDQLIYFDYDHIARAFGGGGGSHSESRDRRDDDRGGRDKDRGDDRGRDDRSRGDDRDRNDRRGGDREESRGKGAGKETELTWDSVHDMTKSELRDLIEDKRELRKVDPADARDTQDLADMVCEALDINKPTARRRAAEDDGKGKDDLDNRLEKLRERRERD